MSKESVESAIRGVGLLRPHWLCQGPFRYVRVPGHGLEDIVCGEHIERNLVGAIMFETLRSRCDLTHSVQLDRRGERVRAAGRCNLHGHLG